MKRHAEPALPEQNLELHITKAAFGGDGIAEVNGKTCFVEGALPGETVIARVLQDKKNFLKARTVKVLEPSPFRTEPPCPYVAACGGCQYQHVDYVEELRIKENQIRDMVSHTLGLDPGLVESIQYSDRDTRYRNSVSLHPTVTDRSREQRLGYIGRDNTTPVVVDDCLIVDERLQPVFRSKFRVEHNAERLTFRLDEKGVIVPDKDERYLRVKIGGETLVTHSQGFFQNNLAVTELLAAKVLEWTDELRPKLFFDLYAGVGTFTFISAKNVPTVVAVEESLPSVTAFGMNASERPSRAVRMAAGRSEKVFPLEYEKAAGAPMLVCLDPPRQGIEPRLAEFLADPAHGQAVIYISCDPATLMRDLKILLGRGERRVRQIVPFDMFPRTRHIEVAVLVI